MFVCCLLWFYVYHHPDFPAFAYILEGASGDYFAKTFALIPMIEEDYTNALLIHFLGRGSGRVIKYININNTNTIHPSIHPSVPLRASVFIHNINKRCD